jgi:methanogenic corrinoid protein MtbC1
MADYPPHLEYVNHLLRLDRRAAEGVVDRFLEHGGDVAGVYADILMPALIHTGREWEHDRISVAHEHYISEVTRELIRSLGPRMWSHAEGEGPSAVACCAPGERHVLGLLMVRDVLRSSGVTVHLLGEGAPAEAIRDFVVESRADWLCLSCTLGLHLPEVAQLIAMVRKERPDVLILLGGSAFDGHPERAQLLGADRYAPDVRALQDLIPDLVGSSRIAVPATPPADVADA